MLHVDDEIVTWMRAHPTTEGHDLNTLAATFGLAPERMRDRLRRLVDQGVLRQSAQIPSVSDANPSYTLLSGD